MGSLPAERAGKPIDIYTLVYIKQVTNKGLLYSTENSTQYSVMAYIRNNLKKKKRVHDLRHVIAEQ